jgi:hypothetical protein
VPVDPSRALPQFHDEEEEGDDLREVLRNAPAWLVSSVFHMLLLIILGVLAVTKQFTPEPVEIAVADDPQMGTQLDDPSVLEGSSSVIENAGPEQIMTPRDLPPVDDPLAAPVDIGDLKIGTTGVGRVTGPSLIEGAPIGLALKGRRAGSKNVLLGRYGGTSVTEKAVEAGLEWLAKQQKPDGSWSMSGPYQDAARGDNITAGTAMALLAFQGHGDTHRDGKYSKKVASGWKWLLKKQRADGLFTSVYPETNHMFYTHAQASIALCELFGMTGDSLYRDPAERAIAFCVQSQDKRGGGWRYNPGEDSDTSVTGWVLMALQSARMAGIEVPEETFERITDYLDEAQLDDGRRYGYWRTTSPSNAVTAEGLLCRQYLGWPQNDSRLVAGVSALNQSPIVYDGSLNHDVYYWYYATQATHHMEGKIWDEWNKVMRVELPAHQTKSGPEAGSWNPQGDKWGLTYGRLYVTCLSIYMLEVYYRHLPIYSGYRAVTGEGGKIQPAPPVPDDAPPTAEAPKGDKPADAADKPPEKDKPAAEE